MSQGMCEMLYSVGNTLGKVIRTNTNEKGGLTLAASSFIFFPGLVACMQDVV